ncbi:regulator of RNase E activity RraA [Kitasatospora sp. GP82]|nr:regulator of RNase E activity RraA [Kitasatospora sp. GP82]
MVDGVIRDLAEVREMGFPVFARGVMPVPGTTAAVGPLNGRVRCGGVNVSAGDIVVAGEEGIVVTPGARREQVLLDARTKPAKEAEESLGAWEAAHRARIDRILSGNGFED